MLKRFFRFLSGVKCALILIAFATAFVIAGTLLESQTESHAYAAQYTYDNPLFLILLFFFFINILSSALRRFPFRKKHFPFLITHLGLLMVILGTGLKIGFGEQGILHLIEGSGSEHFIDSKQWELTFIEKGSLSKTQYPFHKTPWGSFLPELHDKRSFWQRLLTSPEEKSLKAHLVKIIPHGKAEMAAFLEGDKTRIFGLPSFPVEKVPPQESPKKKYPIELNHPVFASSSIYPFQSETPYLALEKLFLETAILKTETDSLPLSQLSSGGLIEGFPIRGALSLKPHPEKGIATSEIALEIGIPSLNKTLTTSLSLMGSDAGQLSNPDIPFSLTLEMPPFLALCEEEGHILLVLATSWGEIFPSLYDGNNPKILALYDEGFSGISALLKEEIPLFPPLKQEEEKLSSLETILFQALEKETSFSPPLEALNAFLGVEGILQFYRSWLNTPSFFPLNGSLSPSFWNGIPEEIIQGCFYAGLLLERIEGEGATTPEAIHASLKKGKWPLLETFNEQEDVKTILSHLIEQAFALAAYLPSDERNLPGSSKESAKWLAAWLSAYQLHPSFLFSDLPNKTPSQRETLALELESPISFKYQPLPLPKKIEEARPAVEVFLFDGEKEEVVLLPLDKELTRLPRSVLGGRYLARFAHLEKTIPYHLRLREGREIRYPGTAQAASYESDVWIKEKNKDPFLTTLSMNRVHETSEGYRFYLSSLSWPESRAKRAQIVVNCDPFKYKLTYPGGCLVALGIFLLFRPSRKK